MYITPRVINIPTSLIKNPTHNPIKDNNSKAKRHPKNDKRFLLGKIKTRQLIQFVNDEYTPSKKCIKTPKDQKKENEIRYTINKVEILLSKIIQIIHQNPIFINDALIIDCHIQRVSMDKASNRDDLETPKKQITPKKNNRITLTKKLYLTP